MPPDLRNSQTFALANDSKYIPNVQWYIMQAYVGGLVKTWIFYHGTCDQ